uniref:Uncharacterized protein n=1 Tax=Anopheles minimus TaxID=112268 RepID=A0A182WP12_9DIPT
PLRRADVRERRPCRECTHSSSTVYSSVLWGKQIVCENIERAEKDNTHNLVCYLYGG